MSVAELPVIVYRYDASPYSIKVDNLLTLKRIPHQRVNVSSVLPRPEITDLLGITYRRIPILAIGNDVYCDTSLIASTLERRFTASAGYGLIFPRTKHASATNTGAIKVFAKHYESIVFPVASTLLPWDKLPRSFIEDRSLFVGAPIDVKAMVGAQSKALATLSSELALLEEQLSDDREWLFDSELPSLADITVHFILTWVNPFIKKVIDVSIFPKTFSWLARVSTHLKGERSRQIAPQVITGDQAAAAIISSAHEPYDVVGYNAQGASQLGVKLNDQVQVAPDDSGRKYPTVGKLVGLNSEQIVIEVQGSKGVLRCHFPRIAYTVTLFRPHKL